MPHIAGERIILREYRMEDLPYMREWVNDPEITDTLSDIFTYPQTLHDTESFLKMMIEGSSRSKGFIIADKESLEYIGQIDLHRLDWKNRCAVLGIVIGRKSHLGKGYGKEAIALIKRFAFDTLNLNRLELEVFEFNERGLRCYQGSGFKEEGRLRQKLYREGKYWDIIQMSILQSEYVSEA
ncbi:GNAT family N-acetyltransferase [Paenibacillus melissococcoides]|uniref:GNAT family N-acetyltransferase n=1 Tax=Paenibacillus melissococcoides TaxID=2912268 RepID=A0ABM9FZW9_9BACL|nr:MULTISPECIES: GNAT family protein [Paenibacillus]MEB9892841.1 GNAT family protein [Bacillus cereus]CAH8244741.1 GNAT family N-acetyltransferase [Paenibacillus melissococcoides]CAH8708838.1 GNAT family N-acetyltransferase [Paenibacillus melissococcoides]CAH8709587.1 GNAT family N-acetyltransferase [Paenibacillus melissococcoides]GIO78204.1 acetyltransferase [Paenibacillus dendritiformis]